MKTLTISLCFFLVAVFFSFAQNNDVEKSLEIIKTFKEKDAGVASFFESSYGYAVLPSIGKGGIGVGGARGKGTVFQGGTPMGDVTMTQVTVGLQLGGQKYAEVIFFETKDAFTDFVETNYEFAAQVSAVALTSGASANAKYNHGVLVFTEALGGLMYEASIGGQKFKVNKY